jgi:hypothetical protein
MLTHTEAGRESLLALARKILGAYVSLRKAALQLNLDGNVRGGAPIFNAGAGITERR